MFQTYKNYSFSEVNSSHLVVSALGGMLRFLLPPACAKPNLYCDALLVIVYVSVSEDLGADGCCLLVGSWGFLLHNSLFSILTALDPWHGGRQGSQKQMLRDAGSTNLATGQLSHWE